MNKIVALVVGSMLMGGALVIALPNNADTTSGSSLLVADSNDAASDEQDTPHGDRGFGGRGGHGKGGPRGHGGPLANVDSVADLTDEQLEKACDRMADHKGDERKDIRKQLHELTLENLGVTEDQMKQARQDAFDSLVADGTISDDQAEKMQEMHDRMGEFETKRADLEEACA